MLYPPLGGAVPARDSADIAADDRDLVVLSTPADELPPVLAGHLTVQHWRDAKREESKAPKTLNRRISSVSSLYKYLAGAAAEFRLPINVPNPAHAQFIARESSDPLEGTRALTATRARQLMGLPAGDDVLDFRDRAILKTYLYTGIRLATACRPRVKDFHQDGAQATLTIKYI
jgi:site-specific recombinase XerD